MPDRVGEKEYCRCKGKKCTDKGCGIPFHEGKISCLKCGKVIEAMERLFGKEIA